MKIFKRLARVLGAFSGRRPVFEGYDPADMGTAFGLDSITVLPEEYSRIASATAARAMHEPDRNRTY